MQNNKLIIFITCFFLFLSFSFLAYSEQKQADPNTKQTWAIYFQDPKSSSLDFTIANHSTQTKFHWQLSVDKQKLQEADVAVAPGATLNISPIDPKLTGKKLSIIVIADNVKKEIYKVL